MKYGFIKIASGATPVRVADCTYNRTKIADAILHYAQNGVEVIFFPQLCLTGATCGDLFLQKSLIDSACNSLLYIADATKNHTILSFVGLPYFYNGRLYNCMAALSKGEILGIIPSSYSIGPLEQNSRYFTSWSGDNATTIVNNSEITIGYKQIFCAENHSAIIACSPYQSNDAGLECTEYALSGANIIGFCGAAIENAVDMNIRSNLITSESVRLLCGTAAAFAGEGESTTDGAYSGYCQIAQSGAVLSQSPLFSRAFALADVDTDLIVAERSKHSFPIQKNVFTRKQFTCNSKILTLTTKLRQNPFLPQNEENFNEFYERILTICAHSLAKRMAHTNSVCAVLGISGGLDSCLALIITVRAFNILKMPLDKIHAISMPCFGTSEQTKQNAELLCKALGVTLNEINIMNSVLNHFEDISHSTDVHDVTYENAQARMRTLILMDIANQNNGIVIGTGDLSELALGWATYGGDHMSMYGVNAGIPKTMIRLIVAYISEAGGADLKKALSDILKTPVSPELLPLNSGSISQKTEDIVGPYELHDFFIYYIVRCGFSPKKTFTLAVNAFDGIYERSVIYKWLSSFYNRFFAQQFKRSCMPDGPMALGISLSPRGGLIMPSDAVANIWKEEISNIEKEI